MLITLLLLHLVYINVSYDFIVYRTLNQWCAFGMGLYAYAISVLFTIIVFIFTFLFYFTP